MFLVWYDDNPKHTLEAKLAEAVAVYTERFGRGPSVIQISTDETAPSGLPYEVRQVGHVRRNNYQLGLIGS